MFRVLTFLLLCCCLQNFFGQSCPWSIKILDQDGAENGIYGCGSNIPKNLTINVPNFRETDQYSIQSIPYNPVINLDQGTALSANVDDDFFQSIDLPFGFNFFGKDYKKVFISPNGVLSFNSSIIIPEYQNPNYTANNPNAALPKPAIFGVFEDLKFLSGTDLSEIYYSIIGNAPCRKLVINYYKGVMVGCETEDLIVSTQIVLSEFTNEIEIYVEDKPAPCSSAPYKNALLGIMNETGSLGYSPIGRNTGIWSANQEAWKFSPAGSAVLPKITWKANGVTLPNTTPSITVTPTQTTTYTAEVSYNTNGQTYTLTDQYLLTFGVGSGPAINTPITFPTDGSVYLTCDNQADLIEDFDFSILTPLIISPPDPTLTITYYATLQEATIGVGSPLKTIHKGSYQIFARVVNSNGCFSIATITLNIDFYPIIDAVPHNDDICYTGPFVKDLNDYLPEMLLSPIAQVPVINYYDDFTKAVAGGGDFISNMQPLDLGEYNFYVRFQDSNGCFVVRKLHIRVIDPTAKMVHFTVCDKDYDNTNTETITLSNYNSEIAGDQPVSVTYYAITDTTYQTPITSLNIGYPYQEVFAMLTLINDPTCKRYFKIRFNLSPIPLAVATAYQDVGLICNNNNLGFGTLDLSAYDHLLIAPQNNYDFSYYKNYNAGVLSGEIPQKYNQVVDGVNTIYVKVKHKSNDCYAVSQLKLDVQFFPAVVLTPHIARKCDTGTPGENFNLRDPEYLTSLFNQSENSILFSDLQSITFYNSKTEADTGDPTKTIPDNQFANPKKIVWARFATKNGCYSVKDLTLKVYGPPKIKANLQATVCDTNFDGKPDINLDKFVAGNNILIIGPDENDVTYEYSFVDFAGNSISKTDFYTIENISQPIYVYITIKGLNGCTNSAPIQFISGTNFALNAGPFSLDVCDVGNDEIEIVNLKQLENNIFPTGNTSDFGYYESLNDIHNLNKIMDPENYPFLKNSPNTTIYVKVENGTNCPAYTQIKLNFLDPPMVNLDLDYLYCPTAPSLHIIPNYSGSAISDYEWINPQGKKFSTPDLQLFGDDVIPGKYQLIIRGINKCVVTKEFNVDKEDIPVITQIIPNGNSYTIIATGTKTIVYSKDGFTWQYSNIFNGLPPGKVTFYVKYEGENCIGIPKDGLILNIKNVITPDGDGYNDYWSIDNLEVFDGVASKLQIYDKYGVKVLELESNSQLIWDGYLAGRKLPTASYWYILSLADGRSFQGWILLKNRN